MPSFKRILFSSVVMLFASFYSNAQAMKDPSNWNYEVIKTSENEYQLIFNLKLDKGFHIWSLKPGGDGFQIVPSFTFEKNTELKMLGSIIENGKIVTQTMEGVDGAVSFISDTVQYVQKVRAIKGTVVKGVHEYQICNDMMCLPPTSKPFSFILN